MIKLIELRTAKYIHQFWATVLTFMKTVNRVDLSGVRSALPKLKKEIPSSGAIIEQKFRNVEQAYKKFRKEAEHFNAYIRSKSYE